MFQHIPFFGVSQISHIPNNLTGFGISSPFQIIHLLELFRDFGQKTLQFFLVETWLLLAKKRDIVSHETMR